ncbi:Cyclopropane-fatty-acyl-phospholipid synthase [Fusarium acuminatum]|uniref:Cyclopropane-fatty-acyl-phospholipid synthase n=1 Tax=Fusarium acuminatum TaxID=5515 RepID=A0ABZ2WSM3_9HYPO
MDGLFEDSSLLSLSTVLAADFVDRLNENRLFTFLTATVVSVYFSLGSKLDIGLTLGFVAWKYYFLIVSLLHSIGLQQFGFVTAIALGTCFLGYFVLRWRTPHKPGSLSVSIGRPASKTERVLEGAFRQYLKYLVEKSPTPLAVRYIPIGVAEASDEVLVSQTTGSSEPANEIDIKILSPVFYSRFVHYAHDSEALFCELAESCTFWTDKPELLINVFLKKGSAPLHAPSLIDFTYFQFIKSLRRRPNRIEKPSAAASRSPQGVDIRGFRMSSMDAFIIAQDDVGLKKAYRTAVNPWEEWAYHGL